MFILYCPHFRVKRRDTGLEKVNQLFVEDPPRERYDACIQCSKGCSISWGSIRSTMNLSCLPSISRRCMTPYSSELAWNVLDRNCATLSAFHVVTQSGTGATLVVAFSAASSCAFLIFNCISCIATTATTAHADENAATADSRQ